MVDANRVKGSASGSAASKIVVVRLDDLTDRSLTVMRWMTGQTKTAVAADAVWGFIEPLVPMSAEDFPRTREAVSCALAGSGMDKDLFDQNRTFRFPLWLRVRLELTAKAAHRNQAELVRAALRWKAMEVIGPVDHDRLTALEDQMVQAESSAIDDLLGLVAATAKETVPPSVLPQRD